MAYKTSQPDVLFPVEFYSSLEMSEYEAQRAAYHLNDGVRAAYQEYLDSVALSNRRMHEQASKIGFDFFGVEPVSYEEYLKGHLQTVHVAVELAF